MNIPAFSSQAKDRRFLLLSLSGGGYRAALYCAGGLRAFYEAGWLDRQVLISAVSGGAIAAYIWDLFLQAPQAWRQSNSLWPEQRLLDLIARSPRRGGRVRWWLRSRIKPSWWQLFLSQWCDETERLVPRSSEANRDEAAVLIAVLDFELGNILAFNRGTLFQPNREIFRFSALPIGGEVTVSSDTCLAAATAVPYYFPPVPAIIRYPKALRPVATTLVDAGVVDNVGIFPFMPLIRLDNDGKSLIDNRDLWYFLDAGKLSNVPRKAGYIDWGLRPNTDKLRAEDHILRLTGDLAQPIYLGEIVSLVNQRVGIRMRGARLGLLEEDMCYYTERLSSPETLVQFPTMVNRIAREDCLVLLTHGAQCASQFFGANAGRVAKVREACEAITDIC